MASPTSSSKELSPYDSEADTETDARSSPETMTEGEPEGAVRAAASLLCVEPPSSSSVLTLTREMLVSFASRPALGAASEAPLPPASPVPLPLVALSLDARSFSRSSSTIPRNWASQGWSHSDAPVAKLK